MSAVIVTTAKERRTSVWTFKIILISSSSIQSTGAWLTPTRVFVTLSPILRTLNLRISFQRALISNQSSWRRREKFTNLPLKWACLHVRGWRRVNTCYSTCTVKLKSFKLIKREFPQHLITVKALNKMKSPLRAIRNPKFSGREISK